MPVEYKKTTLKDDVEDISRKIFEIQAADMAKENETDVPETIDILSNGRGAASGCKHSLLEIADHVDLGDSSYPAQNVKKLLNKATNNFIRNFYLTSIIHAAVLQGFDADDSVSLAEKCWSTEKESGKTDAEILREVING